MGRRTTAAAQGSAETLLTGGLCAEVACDVRYAAWLGRLHRHWTFLPIAEAEALQQRAERRQSDTSAASTAYQAAAVIHGQGACAVCMQAHGNSKCYAYAARWQSVTPQWWTSTQVKFEEAQRQIRQAAAAAPPADGTLQRAAFGLGECLQVPHSWCLVDGRRSGAACRCASEPHGGQWCIAGVG